MDVDRHKLWRIVAANREAMNEDAPEGHEAVVEVTVAGRADVILVGRVETTRNPNPSFPWTMFHSLTEGDGETPHPNDYFLFVPDAYVQAVEIRFRRTGKSPVGFTYAEVDELDALGRARLLPATRARACRADASPIGGMPVAVPGRVS